MEVEEYSKSKVISVPTPKEEGLSLSTKISQEIDKDGTFQFI